ncbi:hypothetical protein ABL78_0704 [Leptomonas seymouri]|uniref:DUF155 domain-containing protein n=1 Tax=Leptomonas seymouri TaxID=5684 RepID=A0A0N0P8P4_LEPSE|nr:hypothetical protein ABL78_0704 [Leptomonas seymouri]|eukprot:KPI90186.1 hypothetical protein ABL78_0704 [Leptomonas seymouri]
MEPFHEPEYFYGSRERSADFSSSSSFSSADHAVQGRSRQRRHHHSQRYAQQLDRDDSYTHYAWRHEASTRTRRPHHRRSSSSSSSTNSSHRDTYPLRSVNDNERDFLSAASDLPIHEETEITHENSNSDALQTDAERLLMKDYVELMWPTGSGLRERRIQQAVHHESLEVEVQEDGFGGGPSLGAAGAAVGTIHATTADVVPSALLWNPHPPPLAPAQSPPRPQQDSSAVADTFTSPLTAPPAAAVGPRMKEAELLADPRNRLLDLVISNTSASVTLGEIEQAMKWSTRYEPMYGPLQEYLQSYQSIFVVSPVDDRVRLRRLFSIRTWQQQRHTSHPRLGRRSGREAAARRSSSAADRRSGKPSLPSAEALAAHIGSVSYSCVGEHLCLAPLETVYRRRGYDTAMMHSVLHVTSENDFHLFLFSSGAVVWWGMDRKDHWMVEDDFLSQSSHISEGVEHRYTQSEIDALFPIWCSYEVDEQCSNMQIDSPLGIQPAAVKPALERLSKVLCFDHYLVPANEPARSLVMLTFSHSLGSSARVDYFEYVTKWSHRLILSIPPEFSGLLDYFSTQRQVAKLEGEIEVAQLAIQSIHDTPEVLWEVPWLQAFYNVAEQQNTAQSRLSWFASRSDTLLEQLSHIKARRYRLFMLGSDVFLIVILILDVMFMTSRLVAKMYFKVEEDY